MSRCKHEWDKVAETTLESAYEQMKDNVKDFTEYRWAFVKTYICILKCIQCGKLDKTIVQNNS